MNKHECLELPAPRTLSIDAGRLRAHEMKENLVPLQAKHEISSIVNVKHFKQNVSLLVSPSTQAYKLQ